MKIVDLNVQGMSCGGCVKHVTKALLSVAGVAHVEVDLANGRARVEGDTLTEFEPLIAALAREDYLATLISGDDAAASPKEESGHSGTGAKSGCCCR